jgi:hypothetical protein
MKNLLIAILIVLIILGTFIFTMTQIANQNKSDQKQFGKARLTFEYIKDDHDICYSVINSHNVIRTIVVIPCEKLESVN